MVSLTCSHHCAHDRSPVSMSVNAAVGVRNVANKRFGVVSSTPCTAIRILAARAAVVAAQVAPALPQNPAWKERWLSRAGGTAAQASRRGRPTGRRGAAARPPGSSGGNPSCTGRTSSARGAGTKAAGCAAGRPRLLQEGRLLRTRSQDGQQRQGSLPPRRVRQTALGRCRRRRREG